ncbi:vWA domain-containing protein [Agreia pratensis]|uniref:von Willebrand factor type A domain-containing protein n=1 Tax=Agreia pratensis TaxID=150121 RepID=A0A1X7K7D2_9MICO|nr:VWA domain-containing protein [Agreia pratensis]SMG36285.1 von Willebrand factor type A domain-containing protein [Agreia pratensis]
MGLANPWILLGLVPVVVAVIVVPRLRRRRQRSDADVPVAHTGRLTRLPGFVAAVSRMRGLSIVTLVVVSLFIATAALLAARPITTSTEKPAKFTRDVVLCLDVSGSMTDVDIDVLERFKELSEGFEGERLALVIFNSSAAQVFPLTDDYDYIAQQLESVRSSLDGTGEFGDAFGGTLTGEGASLIGDGLASCVLTFDRTDEKRSRSVVLATDNDINGTPIMTLDEAGAFAKSRDVRVYGIDPSVTSPGASEDSAEFQRVADSTGGDYFVLESADTVPTIVDGIEATEAALVDDEPKLIVSDQPTPLVVLSLVLLASLLVLAWRARL